MPSAACDVMAIASHKAPLTTAVAGPRADGVDRMQDRQHKQCIGHHAMLELHGERIFEQIAPPRLFEEQPRCGRNQRAVDLRPGIVDAACAQACEQRAQIKLHECQQQQSHAGELQP